MAGTNLFKSKSSYTRSYKDIRGVELNGSGTDISGGRLAYCENMYRDYDGESPGAVESIPGFRRLYSFGSKINGIYLHKTFLSGDYAIVHSGSSLYRFKLSERDSLKSLSSIADISDSKSSAFSFGDDIFILDGQKILRIDETGEVKELGKEIQPYVPTLYFNSQPYEQRNLLTDKFYEKHVIGDPGLYSYSSQGIEFEITDSGKLTCAISGISEDAQGHIDVPGTIKIGDICYTVTEIKDYAFAYNTKISSVKISEGVERIGKFSFYYCTAITKISLPSSVTLIDDAAFSDCLALKEVYLGRGLKNIGTSPFSSCYSLTTVYYEADPSSFKAIENNENIGSREIKYGMTDPSFTLKIPCESKALTLDSVTINGKAKEFNTIKENGKIIAVTFGVAGDWEASNAEIKLSGMLSPYASSFDGGREEKEGKISGAEAIYGCRICEAFDGRIFLSGNPKLPNTVFYTSRDERGANNPLYVGVYNYFNDGIGKYPVISMLAVRDSLGVFKVGDDGCGSIFYHTPKSTEDNLLPKIYPVSYVHSGLCAGGKAISFLDDPVFVTKTGICALNQKTINYERSIACRSHNVNYDLLKEDLSAVTLAEWLGYLVVGVNGKVFLGDSRAIFSHATGNMEYEWFFLNGVGTYKNSTRVYRYATYAPQGYYVHQNSDLICTKTVMSEAYGEETVYYSLENGIKYALYPTEEMAGGDFSPAVLFFGCDDLLFFGTESGDLALFNNDKRGIPPDRLGNDPSFDKDEYKKSFGRKIHPDFYSFDGHAVMYAVKTPFDDCGITHVTKSTVKHSLCLKLKSYASSKITIGVYTDKGEYFEPATVPGADIDFSDLDFSILSLSTEEYFTLPVGEKEKDWIEKQIAVYSESFRSPIGIYSITYRYSPKGRIKNK